MSFATIRGARNTPYDEKSKITLTSGQMLLKFVQWNLCLYWHKLSKNHSNYTDSDVNYDEKV
jgi:hypothetical protein